MEPLIEQRRATSTERDRDALRKRDARSESARITIPECKNPQRRERALRDPELFLRGEYFTNRYSRPFGKLHYAIIDALLEVAENGGKQSIAAPRGRGKSEITKGMLTYLIFAGKVRFPIPVCQTTADAEKIYKDFRNKVANNQKLFEDFPEICAPVRALDGAPQRAGRQHIDGIPTGIIWTNDRLRLANVPAKYRGPIDYGGVFMEFRGLDAAIRGVNNDGTRPDFIIIDDPETRVSARSDAQIADRINAIEKDIAGLAGEDEELAQVMLSTIQNRKCVSYIYTDPEQKPSWMGRRFGWVETWPNEWCKYDETGEQIPGLWHEYMAIRGRDQRAGDRYGRGATQFFLDNQEAMVAGGSLLADNYKAKVLPDGFVTVHSAWQVVFNSIADTSFDAFCTEYQNDPPEVEQIQTIDLSYSHVATCLSGNAQWTIPPWVKHVVRGIDMGKVNCHYVDIGFDTDGTGTVIDYGRFTTHGLAVNSSDEAIELAMLNALQAFAIENNRYNIDLAFVDSGYYPQAIYEACRRLGGRYKPIKGPDSNYKMPKASDTVQCWYECHASLVNDANRRPVWLFHPNTEFWKNWLQERWTQDPFVGGQLTRGSMTLFEPPANDIKFHQTFARSMVSERLEHVPIPGGGYKSVWNVIDRGNNHYLDAAGYACAAGGCLGVRLIQSAHVSVSKTHQSGVHKVREAAHQNNRFRSRPGGWIKGAKRKWN